MTTDLTTALWALHRRLKTSRRRPHLTAQTLRTRAAVDTLIAELTALADLTNQTPEGHLDLDRLERTQNMTDNPTRPGVFILGQLDDEPHFPYELRYVTDDEQTRMTSFRTLAFASLVTDALTGVMVVHHPDSDQWEAGKIITPADGGETFQSLASHESKAMCLALLLESVLDVLTDRVTLPTA